MLIRYRRLKVSIEQYLATEDAPVWLTLSPREWTQAEYLIDLLKPFAFYTLQIGQTKTPTIQYVFPIYNKILSHLEKVEGKLKRKKQTWKKKLCHSIQKSINKLQKYYGDTHSALGDLYGHAILLNPKMKDRYFQTDEWVVEPEDDSWEDVYWKSLRQRFDERYRDPSMKATVQPRPRQTTFSLDSLFSEDLPAILPEDEQDEVALYRNMSTYYGSLYGSYRLILSKGTRDRTTSLSLQFGKSLKVASLV